jgi:hypothetical protein
MRAGTRADGGSGNAGQSIPSSAQRKSATGFLVIFQPSDLFRRVSLLVRAVQGRIPASLIAEFHGSRSQIYDAY